MARANTYELESSSGWGSKHPCEICRGFAKPIHRLFYYPTFMNGDAEWQGDFCNLHKAEGKQKLEKCRNALHKYANL